MGRWRGRPWAEGCNRFAVSIAPMYLRFVEGADSQDGRWMTGVITAARILRDKDQLEPFQIEIVNATHDWFNEDIPVPPFERNLKSGKWSQDAVAWFVPDAVEAIQRMWDLVAVLKDHGVAMRVLRSESPGLIVYRDEYQIVAETAKRTHSSSRTSS
jgi:hypothetical protein